MTTKKDQIEAYILAHRRGTRIVPKWFRFELWDEANIDTSKSTIRATVTSMRDRGLIDVWGKGRTTTWYVREKRRGTSD